MTSLRPCTRRGISTTSSQVGLGGHNSQGSGPDVGQGHSQPGAKGLRTGSTLRGSQPISYTGRSHDNPQSYLKGGHTGR